VGGQVVHEHSVALAQRRYQHLLDIGEEGGSIHRAVNGVGRREAIDAKSRDKRQRLPMPVRYTRDEALRRDRRLIYKDKAPRIENGLLGFELRACGGDVRTILLGGAQRFF
jgi:hypothetical protein